MRSSPKRNLLVAAVAFSFGAAATVHWIREPTVPLDPDVLRSARQRWRQAGIHDYAVRYRMHGSEFAITLKRDVVTSAMVDGRQPSTADLNVYSIEGLFDTLERELENLADPNGPFGSLAHSVLTRVRFHPELGYIERYIRSSAGAARGVAIELIEFRRGE